MLRTVIGRLWRTLAPAGVAAAPACAFSISDPAGARAYYPPQHTPSYGPSRIVNGAEVCSMEHPVATGSKNYCTTAQGRLWGRPI